MSDISIIFSAISIYTPSFALFGRFGGVYGSMGIIYRVAVLCGSVWLILRPALYLFGGKSKISTMLAAGL